MDANPPKELPNSGGPFVVESDYAKAEARVIAGMFGTPLLPDPFTKLRPEEHITITAAQAVLGGPPQQARKLCPYQQRLQVPVVRHRVRDLWRDMFADGTYPEGARFAPYSWQLETKALQHELRVIATGRPVQWVSDQPVSYLDA